MNSFQKQLDALRHQLAKNSSQGHPCEFWRQTEAGDYEFECTSLDDRDCTHTAGDILTADEYHAHVNRRRKASPRFHSIVITTLPIGNPDQPDDSDQF